MGRLLVFTFLLVACFSKAQNKQVLYGLEDVPQALLLNPGTPVPQDFHIGMPFLSQLHVQAGSSGVTAYDIFASGGNDINTRISGAITKMQPSDFFTVNQQLEVLHFGWKSKSGYYFSGGLYQELDMITYFPKDLAVLIWEGNRNYLDYPFDLGQINTSGELLSVYHFGVNKQVDEKLTLGARLKVYSSMFDFRSTNNRGTFTTVYGNGNTNIYEHRLENMDVSMQTSGFGSLVDNDAGSSAIVDQFIGRAFFGGNLGVGVDLGATYAIDDYWTVSASILDIGTIFHTKDVETYSASGSYTLDGIELLFPPLQEGEETTPYYSDLGDEMEENIQVDTTYVSYTSWRPTQFNAALSYGFGRAVGSKKCDCRSMGYSGGDSQVVGLQLYGVVRPKRPQYAATLFYYRRFTEFLAAKATYTVDEYTPYNIGLGVVGTIGRVSVHLAADNWIAYGNLAKANSVSLQFGINYKWQRE